MTVKIKKRNIIDATVTVARTKIKSEVVYVKHINSSGDDYSLSPSQGEVIYDNDVVITDAKVEKEPWL